MAAPDEYLFSVPEQEEPRMDPDGVVREKLRVHNKNPHLWELYWRRGEWRFVRMSWTHRMLGSNMFPTMDDLSRHLDQRYDLQQPEPRADDYVATCHETMRGLEDIKAEFTRMLARALRRHHDRVYTREGRADVKLVERALVQAVGECSEAPKVEDDGPPGLTEARMVEFDTETDKIEALSRARGLRSEAFRIMCNAWNVDPARLVGALAEPADAKEDEDLRREDREADAQDDAAADAEVKRDPEFLKDLREGMYVPGGQDRVLAGHVAAAVLAAEDTVEPPDVGPDERRRLAEMREIATRTRHDPERATLSDLDAMLDVAMAHALAEDDGIRGLKRALREHGQRPAIE